VEREAGRGPLDVEADDKATPVVESPMEPAHGGDPTPRVNGACGGERGKVAIIDADGVGIMGGRGAAEVDGDGVHCGGGGVSAARSLPLPTKLSVRALLPSLRLLPRLPRDPQAQGSRHECLARAAPPCLQCAPAHVQCAPCQALRGSGGEVSTAIASAVHSLPSSPRPHSSTRCSPSARGRAAWTRLPSAGLRRRATACPAQAWSGRGRRALTCGPSREIKRRGGDVAKNIVTRGAHMCHISKTA
jgi:hypothetical protein